MKGTGGSRAAAFVAGGTALLVVAVSLISSIAGRTGVTDPRVRIMTEVASDKSTEIRNQRYQSVQKAMTGEVATTAQRLQEATALATAAGLLLASEAVNGRTPAKESDLVAALFKAGLLPQEFSAGQQAGTVQAPGGVLMVRYRRVPVGVEVVSVGNSRAAGQAILIRVPGDGRSNESGIWLAGSLDEVVIPSPFTPPTDLIAAGWQSDTLPSLR